MPHVDGMSRNPVHPPEDKIITVADNVLKIVPIDEDWIYTMQMQDPKIKDIFEAFANKTPVTSGVKLKQTTSSVKVDCIGKLMMATSW